ncbi:MAG TPA: protein TolQ [Alphaproteobacteria bacterium]|nr:protein TolQ [Alphaproteobacteria bacterium]
MSQQQIITQGGQAVNTVATSVEKVANAGAIENIAGLPTAHDLSMWGLFMQADFVVKFVMILLLISSIVCWAIIFQKISIIKTTKNKINDFLNNFWEGRGGKTMEEFYYETKDRTDDPLSRVFVAGMFECYEKKGKRRPTSRAERALNNASTRELSYIEKNLSFLATVGSAGPFIGLFGTVWGIMNSFQSIAATNNTSLAVVAPGIAEALFATAIGLFAAIPAVIAYNRFNSDVTKISNEMDDFVDELIIYIDREFE